MITPRDKTTLLGNSRKIANDIDDFFDHVSDASDVFTKLLDVYLKVGKPSEEFEQNLDKLNKLETQADTLRRSIISYLYEKTLIPDFRSDVLTMLNRIDDLIGVQQSLAFAMDTEKPDFPGQLHDELRELRRMVEKCIEHILLGARAFFRNIHAVRDHCHKVMFYESEADIQSTKIKRLAFQADMDLAQKAHMRYFIDRIDGVANLAEDIADSLNIYAIKRAM